MTEPLIKLPSVIAKELAEELAKELAEELAAERLAKMQNEIADRESQIASKDAEIQRLRELVSQLSAEKH